MSLITGHHKLCDGEMKIRHITPSSFSSAPSVTACIVAQTSSRMLMIPGSDFDSISSQTILLLK